MLSQNATFRLLSENYPSGKKVFRAYFDQPDPDTGKIIKHWTGIEDTGKSQSTATAHRSVLQWLEDGCPTRKSKSAPPAPRIAFPLVDDLGATLWVSGQSWYLEKLLSRDPNAICRETIENLLGCYRNHVAPVIGQFPIKDVTPSMLDDLVTSLLVRKKLSTQTANHCIQAMRPIFEEAQKRRLIDFNPIKSMLRTPVRVERPRTAFSMEETQALFRWEDFQKVWNSGAIQKGEKLVVHCHPDFNPYQAYAVALITALTSTRVGTVVTLRREDISLEKKGKKSFYVVNLQRSLAPKTGVKKGTKTGSGTSVPVVCEYLDRVLPHLPNSGPLFPSDGQHGIITVYSVRRLLHRALMNIGIDRAALVERGLGFHSFRHTWVTRTSASGVSKKIQSGFTEHADDRTRKRYTHLEAGDLLPALKIQKEIVSGQGVR